MKISLICYFFDLIINKSEIYKIPKWTQFHMKCSKSLRLRLGHLQTSPRPPSHEELLSFGTRSLTYSRVLISTPASISQVFPLQAHGPCSIVTDTPVDSPRS